MKYDKTLLDDVATDCDGSSDEGGWVYDCPHCKECKLRRHSNYEHPTLKWRRVYTCSACGFQAEARLEKPRAENMPNVGVVKGLLTRMRGEP